MASIVKKEWSNQKLVSFIRANVPQIEKGTLQLLIDLEIDGEQFMSLTEDDYEALGVSSPSVIAALKALGSQVEGEEDAPSLSSAKDNDDKTMNDEKKGEISDSEHNGGEGVGRIMGSLQGPGKLPEYGVCSIHNGLPNKFYCSKCDTMVCDGCLLTHEPHKNLITLLQGKPTFLLSELKLLAETLKNQSKHIEAVLRECGLSLDKVKQGTCAAIASVETTKRRLIEDIEHVSDEAIVQIKALETSKLTLLQATIEKNMTFKKEVDSVFSDLKHHLEGSSQGLVMQLRGQLKALSKELLEVLAPRIVGLPPICQVGLQDTMDASVNKIGQVLHQSLFVIQEENGLVTEGVPFNLSQFAKISEPIRYVLALGGNSPSAKYFSSVEIFDLTEQTWVALPRMGSPRGEYPAIGYCLKRIYVAGGASEFNIKLASAEVFDLETKEWTALPSMKTPRCNTSGTFLADQQRFLVVGGHQTLMPNVLSSCEMFDITTNAWSLAPSLSSPRSQHATVLFKGKPVVLGGSDGYTSLSSACLFEPSANCWSSFVPFSKPRNSFGAAVVDNQIFIAGGMCDGSVLGSIEVFTEGGLWEILASKLPRPCFACGAVALDGKRLGVLGGNQGLFDTLDTTSKEKKPLVSLPRSKEPRLALATISFS